jgi:transcriptional regulator with XRE-family HTH domain
MRDRRTPSTSLSAEVIAFLCQRGHSQADIARMLHVSEGYISLVKHKERSLTIDHLELLSLALGMPLGAMLLAVTKPRKIKKQSKELFEVTERLIKLCDEAREQILRQGTSRSRSRKSA